MDSRAQILRCGSAILVGLAALLLSAAGDVPTFSAVKGTLPSISGSNGRIFIYRAPAHLYGGLLGFTGGGDYRPEIVFDGKNLRRAESRAVFYIDASPGRHTVFCDSQSTFVTIKGGEIHYISIEPLAERGSLRLRPIAVDPDQGADEIERLRFIQSAD